MIRLRRPLIEEVLPDEAHRAHLQARCCEASKLAPNDSKIKSRWNSFTQGRGKDHDVGPCVVAAVGALAHGKCAYCESGRPATVDHFWPKSRYPARLFDWDSLLPACRDCNASKDTDFPLANGVPLLLHPVSDEPLARLSWIEVPGGASWPP